MDPSSSTQQTVGYTLCNVLSTPTLLSETMHKRCHHFKWPKSCNSTPTRWFFSLAHVRLLEKYPTIVRVIVPSTFLLKLVWVAKSVSSACLYVTFPLRVISDATHRFPVTVLCLFGHTYHVTTNLNPFVFDFVPKQNCAHCIVTMCVAGKKPQPIIPYP